MIYFGKVLALVILEKITEESDPVIWSLQMNGNTLVVGVKMTST